MPIVVNTLEQRILELSYHHKLSHVSSALNTVNVLADIYSKRKPDDPVVLGNAHAALALYVVLEDHGRCDAEEMIQIHGTHSTRDMEHGIWVSGGSLGQAETIAVGMALADRKRNVWLVTSDGACAEGAVWEAFSVAFKYGLTNLQVSLIANGLGAYSMIDVDLLNSRLSTLLPVKLHRPFLSIPCLQGLAGHYHVLQEPINEHN